MDDDSSDDDSGPGGDAVDLVPDGAPEPVVSNNVPNVEFSNKSNPVVDNRKTAHEGPVVDPYNSTCHESLPVKLLRAPYAPTQQQIDEHNACMHIPYRSWCPICIWGQGKEKGHMEQATAPETPFFESDYCFLTSKSTPELLDGEK